MSPKDKQEALQWADLIDAGVPYDEGELIGFLRRMAEQQGPICDQCGDGIVPHNPGICGTCLAVREMSQFPECTGDPSSCPENEGHGCCKEVGL